jgi:hypothetical protein
VKRKSAHKLVAGDVFLAYVDDWHSRGNIYLDALTDRGVERHVLTFLSRVDKDIINDRWQKIIVLESLGHKPTVVFFDEMITYEIL